MTFEKGKGAWGKGKRSSSKTKKIKEKSFFACTKYAFCLKCLQHELIFKERKTYVKSQKIRESSCKSKQPQK